ncbi:MAG: hypothetical protein ACTHMC_25750 [Pseudobacter sp.]|uniref:hypothetical protein n=1 Tax=Pseudobacter sp. TaxID=2045420 RepID=UPI003F7EBFDE
MKKEFGKLILSAALLLGIATVIHSCGKVKEVIPNTENSLFGNANTTGLYFITDDPKTEFKVPVGVSAVATKDRKIQFTVTSPTGAAEGAQYTLGTNTVTIPAGTASADVLLKGIFAGYPTGRRDTLVFKITGGDIPSIVSSNTYNVVLQKYCNVHIADFDGAYLCQDYYNNAPDGDPYEVELTPGDVSGTTGKVSVLGLWGSAVPFNVSLDWTNPANFTTNIAVQPFLVHPTYGQSTIRPNSTGTFSSCDNTFRIQYEVTVNAGSFGKYYSILTKL